jgi:hypothetical protein
MEHFPTIDLFEVIPRCRLLCPISRCFNNALHGSNTNAKFSRNLHHALALRLEAKHLRFNRG